ncbi:MAG: hypothetical protein ACOYOP_10610 [Microthrixaceae bacterium]
MNDRRWFNSRLPQTLVIAQFLLYFNAFWLALAALGSLRGLGSGGILALLYRVLLFASLAANVYGAYGIANEQKRGYQVAVVAAFLPIAVPAVILLLNGNLFGNLGAVLLPGGIINALFVYALIALLLHTQSREHQKVWFT